MSTNMSKLCEIAQLKQDWDGYGAPPIPQNVIERMAIILCYVARQPEIFPTACESIQFEYGKENDEYLEFTLSEEGLHVFVMDVLGNEHSHDMPFDLQKINEEIDCFYSVE